MSVLIAIALKSLLIGGLTLGLLHLMRMRSAAERSWVAHVGLLALLIMAFAPLALPSWNVPAPAMLTQSALPASAKPALEASRTIPPQAVTPAPTGASVAPPPQVSRARPAVDPLAAATAVYAVPAAVLLFITFLALARLVALQARADVLVDGHWLSALARAQRRMGFKHGTALLTSDELTSPISWGLMRPVILLNSRAVEATNEAEAIIAHELAHVARLDWIKLLLARVATALFWFNPLVWLLAREAHQLREETADDTVLAANIADTDYAQLLVGVARHECPGLLLGAHGVAPSKSSLARRVARVLDVKSARGPVARSFALGVLAGAVFVAAPLAALTLTLTPATATGVKKASLSQFASAPQPVVARQVEVVQADLPHIIARGVSTSVSTAMAAVAPTVKRTMGAEPADDVIDPSDDESDSGMTVIRSARGSTISASRGRAVARGSNGAIAVAIADSGVTAKAVGVTPEFVAAIRAAAPRLSDASLNQINGMRVLGVTPEFAKSIASAGFPWVHARELMEARAVGLSAGYVNAMRSAGVDGDIDDFVQLRAVGVSPNVAARARALGIQHLDADTLIEMNALGTTRADMDHVLKLRLKRVHAAAREAGRDHADPDDGADPNPDG